MHLGFFAPELGSASPHKKLHRYVSSCHQSVLACLWQLLFWFLRRMDVCSVLQWFQMKGSIPFIQKCWEQVPAVSKARLASALSLFAALEGLEFICSIVWSFVGFLCLSLCFSCFLKCSELFEMTSTLDKLSVRTFLCEEPCRILQRAGCLVQNWYNNPIIYSFYNLQSG